MSRYTLHHGDALAALLTIPTGSIDAIVTDPPYSSGGLHKGDRSKSTGDKYILGGAGTAAEQGRPDFSGDQRDQRAFGYWCSLWLGECFRVAKDGALLAVFCDWRQLPMMTDVVQAGGWVWRGIVPWNKTAATRPNKGWYRAQCEYVIVAAKGTPAMWGETAAPALEGFMVCPVERDQVHQTQKPLSLMRWLVGVVPRGGGNSRPVRRLGIYRRCRAAGGLRFHRLRAVAGDRGARSQTSRRGCNSGHSADDRGACMNPQPTIHADGERLPICPECGRAQGVLFGRAPVHETAPCSEKTCPGSGKLIVMDRT